ncbi:hypothetical protein [Streptomyces sp. NPDC055107]
MAARWAVSDPETARTPETADRLQDDHPRRTADVIAWITVEPGDEFE